jgi:hypothetical protein
MKTLVERLLECANESWPFADACSNMRDPANDNNFGRAAMAMREAATYIQEMEHDSTLECVRAITEECHRLRSQRDCLDLALREISIGLVPDDSIANHRNRYQICAARMCGIACAALRIVI